MRQSTCTHALHQGVGVAAEDNGQRSAGVLQEELHCIRAWAAHQAHSDTA